MCKFVDLQYLVLFQLAIGYNLNRRVSFFLKVVELRNLHHFKATNLVWTAATEALSLLVVGDLHRVVTDANTPKQVVQT